MITKKSQNMDEFFNISKRQHNCSGLTESAKIFTARNTKTRANDNSDDNNDNIASNNRIFSCKLCDYSTSKNCDYIKHLATKRHILRQPDPKILIIPKNQCSICKKIFSAASNLSRHKKKCIGSTEKKCLNNNSDEVLLQFIKENKEIQNILIEQNKELQNKMIQQNEEFMKKTEEQSKQILELSRPRSITNNITNSNNKHFNIQVFLNDQCRDAINIMDFLHSLHVQVSDLEKTGELGYVNGITRILVNGLRKLDLYKRPIHCTDIKRETVYIKDENVWEKENTDKQRLKKVVSRVSQLNLRQLKNWQDQNPQYEDLTSSTNDKFIKLSTNAIGSCSTEEDEKNIDKIMKNVLKEVVIERREPYGIVQSPTSY